MRSRMKLRNVRVRNKLIAVRVTLKLFHAFSAH